MKHQDLFSSKDKSKKIKVSSVAILLGALRVKPPELMIGIFSYNQLLVSVFLCQEHAGFCLFNTFLVIFEHE